MKYVFIIGLTAILIACTPTEDITNEQLSEPLVIGLMPTMDSVAIATAYELGFFDNHGLTVELIPFSSARDRDTAFQTGQLDGATTDLISVGLFNEGGFDVKATSVTTAHFTLIADPRYHTWADLADATVIISNNTAIDFVLDRMLDNYGLDHDHIIREEVPHIPTRFELVRTGGADAALLSEPFPTMGIAEGLNVITDTLRIDFNPFVLAFRADVIDHRKNDLQAFYLAYNEAVHFLNNEPIEAHLDMIIDLIGFPEEVINYIQLPHFLTSEIPTEAITNSAIDWLRSRGLVTQDFRADDFIYEIDPN